MYDFHLIIFICVLISSCYICAIVCCYKIYKGTKLLIPFLPIIYFVAIYIYLIGCIIKGDNYGSKTR
jgi:hypothetical protein